MPDIIIRHNLDETVGHMNDAAFKTSMTFIEYHVDEKEQTECENMETIMRRLGAGRSPLYDSSPSCTYKIGQPPYFVLNMLELDGYRVVGTNTVSNHLIWTLHRQPQPQA